MKAIWDGRTTFSMSNDERMRQKKDALWEIHEQKCLVASLEKKVNDNFDAQGRILRMWESGSLVVVGGQGVMSEEANGTVTRLPTVDNEWRRTLTECIEARSKLVKLEETFKRILGA